MTNSPFRLCSLFSNLTPDPVDISLEYLAICRTFPETVTIPSIQTHIRHFVEFQWSVALYVCFLSSNLMSMNTYSARRPWFKQFRTALSNCGTVDEIEHLVARKVERWRGRTPRQTTNDDGDADSDASGDDDEHTDRLGDFDDLSILG